jgi:hypothetical protein
MMNSDALIKNGTETKTRVACASGRSRKSPGIWLK